MMEALLFDQKTLSLKYTTNREIPKLELENDILVEVEYAGICGTDVHIIEGHFPCNDRNPFVMGHEFVGIVVKVGPKANFKIGQRVSVDPNSGCGVCQACHKGNYHLCDVGGINNTVGIWRDGGWAKFCRVPDTQVFLMPDTITPMQGALTEPLSCLARGWDRAGRIPIGEDILVMGAGIIGILWSELFHLQGHKRVTISEPNQDRRNLVTKIGLDYTALSPAEISSSGKSYDVIVDCTGVAAAMSSGFPLLKKGGRYVVFGCCDPKSTTTINPFDIYCKEATIIGVMVNPFTFPKAIGLIEAMGDKYLSYEKLGIKVYPVSKYEEAFKELKKGAISKAMFVL